MPEIINGSSTNRIKILILADTSGWIVDRITDEIIRRVPHDFTKRYYAHISTDELISLAGENDIVHYQNWDLKYHWPRILELGDKLLVTCRSHRYGEEFITAYRTINTHVISPDLHTIFPRSVYIPDGIFVPNYNFTVGFAGRPDEYKGYHLIKQACEELGITFKPATDISPENMGEYYRSIDLYVCASENEAHNTPVMECLAIGKPVITTAVGIPKYLNVPKIERSVEGIKKGILDFKNKNDLSRYTWEYVCGEMTKMYESINKKS